MRRLDWRAAGALLISHRRSACVGQRLWCSTKRVRSKRSNANADDARPRRCQAASRRRHRRSRRQRPQPSPPTATPQASGKGRRGATAAPSGAPQATATPTSPAYSSLDGSWEVQVQKYDATTYSSFTLKQDGNSVSGTWNVDGKKLPDERFVRWSRLPFYGNRGHRQPRLERLYRELDRHGRHRR